MSDLKKNINHIVKELQERIIQVEDDMEEFRTKGMLLEYNIYAYVYSSLLSYHDWLVMEVSTWI